MFAAVVGVVDVALLVLPTETLERRCELMVLRGGACAAAGGPYAARELGACPVDHLCGQDAAPRGTVTAGPYSQGIVLPTELA